MSLSYVDLCHNLFASPGVYFPLSRSFSEEDFTALLRILQAKAGVDVSPEKEARYWESLTQRMEGKSRWDQVAPRVTPKDDDLESQRQYGLSRHTVKNILASRPYLGFTIDSITYVTDVFNPLDELGMQYAEAGEPVVVLLLGETQWGKVQAQLVRNEQFYLILRAFTEVLNPQMAAGMNEATMATLMLAYQEQRLGRAVSPWSFFFDLTVMRSPKPVGDVALNRYFKRFERWEHERVMLQVTDGLNANMNTKCADAAKLLGMKYVLELHPDWV